MGNTTRAGTNRADLRFFLVTEVTIRVIRKSDYENVHTSAGYFRPLFGGTEPGCSSGDIPQARKNVF
jgi:hypothetical protein